jgi:transposase-like protein
LGATKQSKIGERLMIEMLRQMTCPECRSRNTYLMKEESKALEDIGFAWYGCRDCGDKFIRKFSKSKMKK